MIVSSTCKSGFRRSTVRGFAEPPRGPKRGTFRANLESSDDIPRQCAIDQSQPCRLRANDVVQLSYDPVSGGGYLYGNDAARARTEETLSVPIPGDQQGGDVRFAAGGDDEDEVFAITPEAIESALWLSLYGFGDMPGNRIDGAYHRSCILSELHNFNEVIVCRPLANGWGKDNKLPRSYFDVQDWNTEMWFSVGYKADGFSNS